VSHLFLQREQKGCTECPIQTDNSPQLPFISAEGAVLGVLQVDSRDIQNGFSQDDLEVLAGITGQAGKAVEQATAHDEKVAQEQFKRDLELANRVQQGLLPSVPPEIKGFEAYITINNTFIESKTAIARRISGKNSSLRRRNFIYKRKT